MVQNLAREARRERTVGRPLTWAPPTLSNPLVVTVTDDPATRFIDAAGRDVQLILPTTVSNWGDFTTRDSLIHVKDPRHVVCIGGRIKALPSPLTTVTAAADATQTTLTVASTSGYPGTGVLRVDGESIIYTGKTATSFTGLTRNYGFFNNSAMSSLTHAIGATVYLSEGSRQGIYVESASGTVHLEGLLLDGDMGDGIRLYGTATEAVQIQNCHINAGLSYDRVLQTDGHGDCIQVLRGFSELRLDRVTLITRDGSCFLNQSSDTLKLGKAIWRDVEAIGLPGARGTIVNRDAATAFECYNAWSVMASGDPWGTAGGGLSRTEFQNGKWPTDWMFVNPSQVGAGYVSPGYLS